MPSARPFPGPGDHRPQPSLLQSASSSEQRLNYLMSLWGLRTGWTLEQRRTFFEALRDAEQAHGARDYYSVVANLPEEPDHSMSSAERYWR